MTAALFARPAPPASEKDFQAAVVGLARVATEAEVAWAAGLFEGEGCWSVMRRSRARAQLAMTDEDVVRRFAAIAGCGAIARRERPPWKTQYVWQTQGSREIRALIELFQPFLGLRRAAKAKAVLAYLESVGIPWGERSECLRGHSLSGDNLVLRPGKRKGQIQRVCLTCRRERTRLWMRAWRARNKAA